MSDSGLTICIGDGCPEGDSDTYGESSTPHDTQAEATQGETLSGSSQHAANADSDWRAITSAPDFCWVGNSITGFDSIATLDNPVRYSPNVIAAGRKLYREGDLFLGIQGDAGQHVVSGTSLGRGCVLITGGQDNVKANGLPMARHDSPCTVNCNAAGVGGTPGYLMTDPQDVESSPGQAGGEGPSYNPGEEAGFVLLDMWEDANAAAKTAWEMLPLTSDDATTEAARGRAWQGAKDTYEAVDVLTGPSPLDLLDSGIGWLQGDAERAGQFGEEWKRTGEAYGGIKDSMVNAWQEAEERNGFFGAVEMSAMVLVTELAGGKGTGAVRGATKVVNRTPETPPPPPPSKGVHVESPSARMEGNNASGGSNDSGLAPVPDNPSAYSVAFEMRLEPVDFGRSRSVHFNRANASLDNAMQSDPQFLRMMDDLIPGAQSSVSSVGGRATPNGWTWEHASTATAFGEQGVMRLVPSEQHTPGSPFWRVLHPDTGAAGGYSEWAIPRGAPKN